MYNKIWMKIYNLQIQVYAEFVYVQMYVVFIIFCSLQVGIDYVTDKINWKWDESYIFFN